MKEVFSITREEAETVVRNLMKEWIPPDDQPVIYKLITRLLGELKE